MKTVDLLLSTIERDLRMMRLSIARVMNELGHLSHGLTQDIDQLASEPLDVIDSQSVKADEITQEMLDEYAGLLANERDGYLIKHAEREYE